MIKFFSKRFERLQDWRKSEIRNRRIIEKYNLDKEYIQRQLVLEFNRIQEKKSALTKSQRDHVEALVYFMIEQRLVVVTKWR